MLMVSRSNGDGMRCITKQSISHWLQSSFLNSYTRQEKTLWLLSSSIVKSPAIQGKIRSKGRGFLNELSSAHARISCKKLTYSLKNQVVIAPLISALQDK